ncbi:ABC transporter substrate-binding protein [Paenibacillus sp. FSL R7-0273]|uniref:sugar ABC transporter substrate-binding protein n=1 Tax=Paenibacillus sp. FSL R7-0273 TaxID=1536772 RepID=UPI0004F71293|nr:sugar ABC transporter substrate-binding protein [Paenibacillus sp. FSL R7-0273]AIQ46908.1 ABC transporter substrate-binding protein [Paenibacillus sp. FSL R7-0273]OMF97328.1 ABC transporter substrate-binding protein [Paenibacillus sp. FSL R7-0273]
MTKNKGLTTAALLLSFSMVAAGCGNSNNAASGDNKTLKVWFMGTADTVEPIADMYEAANPGITVDVQAIPWDTAHDKLLTAVASKSGPDVVQMGTTWIPEFAAAGALKDLSPYIEQYPSMAPENFFDGAVETTKYEDTTVGIPFYVETRAMFYRTDLLGEVGYPEGPKTWDELKDASRKLVEKGGTGHYALPIEGKDSIYPVIFAWQNGSDIIDADRQPQFNQPAYVETVDFLKSFYDEGLSPKGTDLDTVAAFKDGTMAMFISGPWMIQTVKDKAPEIDGKWAVTTLPAKVSNTSSIGGADLSIFNYSKNPDEAAKFIAFMAEQEAQLKYYETSNSMPALKAAWSNEALSDPMIAAFGKQLENSRPAPTVREYEEIAQAAMAAFEQITIGGADTQTELDKLNDKANELLGNK